MIVWVCRMSWKHDPRDRSDWITRKQAETQRGLCDKHWAESQHNLTTLRIKAAYEKAQSPRARALLLEALSAHENGDASHKSSEYAERVDDTPSLSGYLVRQAHEHHTDGEQQ